ncbi:MAG: lasso peptide biosynthesis B2 protein [Vicinamibacteria bacterium]|nr:lasso peptide biosynthesis B2 protein [Vicinamibacteria bacterium]
MLLMVRLGLSLVDVSRLRRVAGHLAPRCDLTPQRLADLVRMSSQALPGLTLCVPRAVVLEALLIRAGHAAVLRIGLTPLAGRERPEAHAWVEIEGVAVAEDPSRYTTLPLFGTSG